MRIKVTFKAGKLPILYRHRFMALIKEALKKSDAAYKESFYPDKNSEHSKIVKPFCFSVSMPSGKIAKKEKSLLTKAWRLKTRFSIFYRIAASLFI